MKNNSMFKEKFIFTLEGDWNNHLRHKTSVKSLLEFLEETSSIKHTHRHCSTREEFSNRLNEFIKSSYKKYGILYLAFHGEKNGILVGKELIQLDEISELFQGKFKDKIVHFGSCSTLNIDKRHKKRFLRETEALCVSGYRKDVDFMISAAFEILYFTLCQQYKNISLVERDLKKFYKCMVKENEFDMIYL